MSFEEMKAKLTGTSQHVTPADLSHGDILKMTLDKMTDRYPEKTQEYRRELYQALVESCDKNVILKLSGDGALLFCFTGEEITSVESLNTMSIEVREVMEK